MPSGSIKWLLSNCGLCSARGAGWQAGRGPGARGRSASMLCGRGLRLRRSRGLLEAASCAAGVHGERCVHSRGCLWKEMREC